VTTTNGAGACYNTEFIPDVMKALNRAFAPANVQFYMSCVGIDTIKNDAVYDFVGSHSNNTLISSTLAIPETINIYYVNSIDGLDSPIAGNCPRGWDHILIRNHNYGAVGYTDTNGNYQISYEYFTVHIHEMGHYFGLPHTFEYFDKPDRELPDGSNCSVAGDRFCDTPADVDPSYVYVPVDRI
jgi:hypothetical protein